MANQSAKSIIASNKKIIIGYSIGFFIVALLAFLIQLSINYFKKKNPIVPEINEAFKWNAAIFGILFLRAYLSSRPIHDQQTNRYRPGRELYQSTIIDRVLLSIIVQFIVMFTMKGLYIYILVPVYAIYAIIRKVMNFM